MSDYSGGGYRVSNGRGTGGYSVPTADWGNHSTPANSVPTWGSGGSWGNNGSATVPTFPSGSMNEAHARRHPSTGRQNGTDVYQGGRYGGTYTNSGTYVYDPNGKAVLGE